MQLFFGKRRREQRIARTDAQLKAILEPAEKRAAVASKETQKLNQLLEEAKSGDFTSKLRLAMTGGEQ